MADPPESCWLQAFGHSADDTATVFPSHRWFQRQLNTRLSRRRRGRGRATPPGRFPVPGPIRCRTRSTPHRSTLSLSPLFLSVYLLLPLITSHANAPLFPFSSSLGNCLESRGCFSVTFITPTIKNLAIKCYYVNVIKNWRFDKKMFGDNFVIVLCTTKFEYSLENWRFEHYCDIYRSVVGLFIVHMIAIVFDLRLRYK